MLIGCCHCDDTPSESTPPPSESTPPPSESSNPPSESEISIMGEQWNCSSCTVLPVRFTVTGIERSKYTFNSFSGFPSPNQDCPSMFGPIDVVFNRFFPRPITPNSNTNCQEWVSSEFAINCTRDNCSGGCVPWVPSCQIAAPVSVGAPLQRRAVLTLLRGNMLTRSVSWRFTWSYAYQDQPATSVARTLIWTGSNIVDPDGNCVKPITLVGGSESALGRAYTGPGFAITLTPS